MAKIVQIISSSYNIYGLDEDGVMYKFYSEYVGFNMVRPAYWEEVIKSPKVEDEK